MYSAILYLQVVLVMVIEVKRSEKCTKRYTIIPGSPGCDNRDGDQGNIGPPGTKGDPGSVALTGEYLNHVVDSFTAKIHKMNTPLILLVVLVTTLVQTLSV